MIRLRGLSSTDPGAPTGTWHIFRFSAQRNRFQLDAVQGPDAENFSLHRVSSNVNGEDAGVTAFEYIADVDGVFDEDAGEIRITAPLKELARYEVIRKGTRFASFRSVSRRRVGYHGDLPVFSDNGAQPSDEARSNTATYAAGTASCVKVGQ